MSARDPMDIYADGNMDEYCATTGITPGEFEVMMYENEPVEVPDYFTESAGIAEDMALWGD